MQYLFGKYNKIYKITKTEIGSPCNENGEYKNYQKNNRMDAIFKQDQ